MNFLDEKQKKRADANQNWTSQDERECLVAVMALMRENKITSVEENSDFFNLLFQKYAAQEFILKGCDAWIRNDDMYILLYYYYLKQNNKIVDGERDFLAENPVLARKSVHTQEMHDFLNIFGTSLTTGRVCETAADFVLNMIITALHDYCCESFSKDAKKAENYKQNLCEMFAEREKNFDVAFFYIVAFANCKKNCQEFSDLIQKCKCDYEKILQQGIGDAQFYLKIWNKIETASEESDFPFCILQVLQVGENMYMSRRSFALVQNRSKISMGSIGNDGEEGLIATFLRFQFMLTLRSDVDNHLCLFSQKIYRNLKESDALIRLKNLFSSATAILAWCELTDSVAGHVGEGATQIALAFKEFGLPDIDQPSFFYKLETLPRVHFRVGFVDDNYQAQDYCLAIGPLDCRLQVELVFANYVGTVQKPDTKLPLSTIEFVFGNTKESIFKVSQRLYFSAFGESSRVFVFQLLESFAKSNFNDQKLEKMVAMHNKKIGYLADLETFSTENNFYAKTTEAISLRLEREIIRNLKVEIDIILSQLQVARKKMQKEKDVELEKRTKLVTVSRKEQEINIKNASLIGTDLIGDNNDLLQYVAKETEIAHSLPVEVQKKKAFAVASSENYSTKKARFATNEEEKNADCIVDLDKEVKNENTQEDGQYFICFVWSNDTSNKNAKDRVVGVSYYYWPLLKDIVIQEGQFCEFTKKQVKEYIETPGWDCLYPLVNVEQIKIFCKEFPSEFMMNLWTFDYEKWPIEAKVFQSFGEFEKRRKRFLEFWVKKIWYFADQKSCLVHISAKVEPENDELHHLNLGCGFLIFDAYLLQENLGEQFEMRLTDASQKFPWSSGEEAMEFLRPKNARMKNIIYGKEYKIPRKDKILLTKMTVDQAVQIFKAKEDKIELPEIQSGTRLLKRSNSTRSNLDTQKRRSDKIEEDNEDDNTNNNNNNNNNLQSEKEKNNNNKNIKKNSSAKKARMQVIEVDEKNLQIIAVAPSPKQCKLSGVLNFVRLVQRKGSLYCLLLEKDYNDLVVYNNSLWNLKTFEVPEDIAKMSLEEFPLLKIIKS